MIKPQDLTFARYREILVEAASWVREFYNLELSQLPESERCLGFVRPPSTCISLGAKQVRRFIDVCLAQGGCTVEFMNSANAPPAYNLGDYVSWLVAEKVTPEGKLKHLLIIYDRARVQAFIKTASDTDKMLSKIYLHEFGHAVLHASLYSKQNPGAFVKVDDIQENEAYLFCLFAWGILVGDYAQFRTSSHLTEDAWYVA